jgi:hypothetical protein
MFINRNPVGFPRCFDSITQFKQWHISALRSKEACTPCHDCTPYHKKDMMVRGRCRPVEVHEQYTVNQGLAKTLEELVAPLLQEEKSI